MADDDYLYSDDVFGKTKEKKIYSDKEVAKEQLMSQILEADEEDICRGMAISKIDALCQKMETTAFDDRFKTKIKERLEQLVFLAHYDTIVACEKINRTKDEDLCCFVTRGIVYLFIL
jgi:hypothetical protein